MKIEYTDILPVAFPEAAMKAGLLHRTHQGLSYTLTSDSLMAVRLWPLAVVTQRLPDLWNQKTRWRMEGGGGRAGWLLCWCVDTEGLSVQQLLLLLYTHLRDMITNPRWFNIGDTTQRSDSVSTWCSQLDKRRAPPYSTSVTQTIAELPL